MPTSYIRPELEGLTLVEEPGGVRVTQAGRSYLARRWRLTPEVLKVIEAALARGLTCLWQHGHPGGDESHHISFSFSHSPSSWVFVIGGEAKPPGLRCVTFNKRLKEYFHHAGLGWMWAWETAGGKNILVQPEDLDSVLRTLPLEEIKAGRLPTLAPRRKAAAAQFFASEEELEAELAALLMKASEGAASIQRQRRFGPNNAFEVASRPDILVVEPARLLVVEIKLHEASEVELSQLLRYLANSDLASSFGTRARHGVLVAGRFTSEAIAKSKGRDDVSLAEYRQDASGALQLHTIAGKRVLEEWMGT